MALDVRPQLKFYSLHNLDQLPQIDLLPDHFRREMQWVARVFPFRTNSYVVDELIDWSAVPDDPIFQLTFPQPGMLESAHRARIERAWQESRTGVQEGRQFTPLQRDTIQQIQLELNPHPQGQLQYNVPTCDGEVVAGLQHKYAETALVFPSAGQTCHAYCSFCFRWAQFVGMPDLKLATDESTRFCEYLRRHREVTDVLLTGGDPMIMRADVLARYIDPLLGGDFDHIRTIRIGTKSLAYWPYRFFADSDSDDLARLFERVIAGGKHLAIMAHFNHWRELSTGAVGRALQRVRDLGASVRSQSPVVRHINDDENVWARMWQEQVQLGVYPYYMFVGRDTGAQHYFKVPLSRVYEIYCRALRQVSGLARTARGPVMSALPGKVMIEGTAEIGSERVFVLKFLQARDPAWCGRPFFATYDPAAHWLTDLRPSGSEPEFFYEQPLRDCLQQRGSAWNPPLPAAPIGSDVLMAGAETAITAA